MSLDPKDSERDVMPPITTADTSSLHNTPMAIDMLYSSRRVFFTEEAGHQISSQVMDGTSTKKVLFSSGMIHCLP
jgi:hypothetical protein